MTRKTQRDLIKAADLIGQARTMRSLKGFNEDLDKQVNAELEIIKKHYDAIMEEIVKPVIVDVELLDEFENDLN